MMLYPILEHGATFTYNNQDYQTVGTDISNMQIEAVSVPFDGNYYWFQVKNKGTKVELLN